jgi:3-oxoacyl-[acyl-carrier-protein] synthase II
VVVTGMGAISPFGSGVSPLVDSLAAGRSGVKAVPELSAVGGLRSLVAGPVPGVDAKQIPRKFRRSMSSMSIFATLAAQEALGQGRVEQGLLEGGRLGVVIGSTVGSTQTSQEFFKDYLVDLSLERMKSTVFFHIMGHSCAANVSQALGIRGRVVAPSAACATGCQAVGLAYEMIAAGKQDLVLCGGADELHPLTTATFDVMNAASTSYNDRPHETPRPFDRGRDGVVCAEGGGILLLEALDSALGRGAEILAEVVGFSSLSDPASIANPHADAMETCMRAALADARVTPQAVDYVNAHATGTELGDAAESEAVGRVVGARVPVSSLKGHLGHTMAASGALELIATVEMIRRGVILPTLNLDDVDPACAGVDHVTRAREAGLATVIKNSFAMGGINSSLVLRRSPDD